MKRYILVLMMVLFALAGGEDRIYQTYYNDGTQNLFPDSCSIELYFDGVVVDSVCIDSTANWQEDNRILVCTLSTTDKGEHWILETFVEGTDTASNIVLWDNDYDTIQRVAALEASVTTLRDTTNAIHDTLQDGANGILADVNAISTDQTAADSLERMLDGNRATLYLSQLSIVAQDGNKSAIVATGEGSGHGMDIDGGTTGYGARISGGASSGYGALIEATGGNSKGLTAAGSGSGSGANFVGGVTGVGFKITGGGTSGDGIDISLTSGYGIDLNGETINGILDSVDKAPSVTMSAADMAQVADSVWGADFEAHDGTAGSFGDSAQGWGATAATGLTAAGLADTLEGRGMITYSRGADSVLRLAGLIIVDTLNSDSLPAFYVTGNDGTVWFRARDNNTALSLTGPGPAASFYIYSDSGNGVQIGSAGRSAEHTVTIYNNGEGDAVRIACGNNNDTGTVLNLVHAGTDSTETTYALQTEGMIYLHGRADRSEDAIRAHAYKAGKVIYFWSDSIPSRWSTTAGDSVALLFAGGIRTDIEGTIDKATEVDTVLSTITASASLTGTGPYGLTIYAIDTSGTDDTVSSRMLSVYDATGSRVGYAPTQSNGSIRFGLDSGTYTIKSPTVGGYYWDSVVCLVDAADTTFDLTGWNIAIGAPSGDSLCRVYGYAYGPDGNALEGAIVTWQITGRNIWDICNGTSINKSSGSTTSDSTGLWTLDLLYSICLQRSASGTDSIAYKFNIDYPSGLPVVNQTFYVPAADSAEFTW